MARPNLIIVSLNNSNLKRGIIVKKIVVVLSLLALVGCSSNKPLSTSVTDNYALQQSLIESSVTNQPPAAAVSGSPNWIPMVFVDFDTTALSSLADSLKTGKVKRAAIIYPSKMKTLAQRIQRYLEDQTSQDVPMLNVELRNTEQVQYDLSQVIVTLYF